MVEFEDPITDAEYDTGNLPGLGMQAFMMVGGITMTLLLFATSNNVVLPWVADLLGNFGADPTGESSNIPVAGD
jgi:hypothetical protein